MDDAALAEFVDRAAAVGRACTDIEDRRDFLARLNRSLVDQMTKAGFNLFEAGAKAGRIVDQVREKIVDGADA